MASRSVFSAPVPRHERHLGFADEPETEARPNGGKARPGTGRTLSTIWADDITLDLSGGGLIDGLLPKTGLTVLYGESGAGKTFVTLDLACHIAAGRPWRGMAVEQGVVVYVAAEAPQSV